MKQLHPASAVFRALSAGSVGSGLALLGSGLLSGAVFGEIGITSAFIILPLTLLGGLVGVVFGVMQYLRFEYDVNEETVSLRHGVLARTERDVPFGRIQNVDIRRGLVSRLIGVATVNLETAGGGSTEAVLKVVDLEEARRIQDVVAGYVDDEAGAKTSTTHAGAATEDVTVTESAEGPAHDDREDRDGERSVGDTERETLFELSDRDLAVMSAVSLDPSGLGLLLISLPFGQEFAFEVLSQTVAALGGPVIPSLEALTGLPTPQLAVVLLVAAVQFLLAAWVASAVVTAIKFYDFRLIRVGDDLRYERGLLGRYTGTIPLEKVQTLTIRENVAMRRVGMAALDLETAGYGPNQSGQTSNIAVPLDDRETVYALAERLGDQEVPAPERPPRRARRRYAVRMALVPLALAGGLLALHTFVTPFPRWWLPALAVVLAPAAGHYRWLHRGHATTERAVVTRSGFWRRSTRLVPYYRVQTVIDERTVFQRWRSLASVTADTASTASLVGGDATAHDVDESTARSLHGTLRERLARDVARHREGEPVGIGERFAEEGVSESEAS